MRSWWARDVMAVAADAGITDPPVIIGHSMGGFVALRAAGLFGPDLEGIVVIDSPVQDLTPEQQAAREAQDAVQDADLRAIQKPCRITYARNPRPMRRPSSNCSRCCCA